MRKKASFVSIIITTKNEEKNIGGCLESIKRQSYPQGKIEIIVVDNSSADKTKEIAQKYTKKVFNLPNLSDLTKVKNFRGAQLNFGIRRSSGGIIFFPDADMTFDEELIEEAVRLIDKGELDALYIPEVVVGKGLFGKIRNFERSFYNETCIDAVRVMRKNLFLKVGGFDEENISFGFDDWDFMKTIKKITPKIGITRNKIYHHEESMTMEKYISKKGEYVEGAEDYIQKWGENDSDIRKQFGFWYRYFWVFIENGKWKRLFRHPILTGGMYFLRLAVGIVYLYQKSFKK